MAYIGDIETNKCYLGDIEISSFLGDVEVCNAYKDELVYAIDTGAGTEFELTGNPSFNYNAEIDWGDGTTSQMTAHYNGTHTYDTPGEYIVMVTGLYEAFHTTGSATSQNLIKKVLNVGSTGLKSMQNFLYQANIIESCDFGANDLSTLESFERPYLSMVPENELYGFEDIDVSNVTYAYSMFSGIKTPVNISNLNFTSLGNGYRLFISSDELLTGVLNAPVLTSAIQMFMGASNCGVILPSGPNSVTNLGQMFYGASGTYDMSHFDTSSVTSVHSILLYGYAKLIFEENAFRNTTSLNKMCYNSKAGSSINIVDFDTSSVTDFTEMMYNSHTQADFTGLDTSSATELVGLFHNYYSTAAINAAGLIHSGITSIKYLFGSCQASQINGLATADISNLVSAEYAFSSARSATLDISNWDVTNIINAKGMLAYGAEWDISSWELLSATDISYFCRYADMSKHTGVEKIIAPVAEIAEHLYSYAAVPDIDLTGIPVENITSFRGMFAGSDFETLSAPTNMFQICTSM